MKSSAWKISIDFCIAVALLFISLEIASAETLLGKVTLLGADGRTDVYPVVSGKKIAYGEKALIRLAGATFVAEEGSALEVIDQGEQLGIDIEKGVVHFRIQPHRTVISFVTKDGSFDTPRVVTADTSVIEGTITVNEKGTTVELADGSVAALTTDGLRTVNAGERIQLAQSQVDGESTVETENVVVDTPAEEPEAGNSTTEPGGNSGLAGAASDTAELEQ